MSAVCARMCSASTCKPANLLRLSCPIPEQAQAQPHSMPVTQVVATCLDTLQPIILDDFSSPEDLRQCLRASAQVPAVAGDPVLHRGRRMVDAAVFEPVPFRAAISDGCTHVLTLCSRPPTK